MFEQVEDAVGVLRPVVAKLGDAPLNGMEAVWLVAAFAEAEKLCAAGRALAMREVAKSDAWCGDGAPSPAAWMANKASIPLGQAVTTMEMVERLDGLPAVAGAFRAGRLSLAQAREIVAAARDCPEDEEELLEFASSSTMTELKEYCRRVRAKAVPDPAERQERIRRSRYLRGWTDDDGAVRIDARLTPDDGALVLALPSTPARPACGPRPGPGATTRTPWPTTPTPWWSWPGPVAGRGPAAPRPPSTSTSTTPPCCGASSSTASAVRSPAWAPSPWRPSAGCSPTASSR